MKKILGIVIVGCLAACGGTSPDDAFRSTASGDDSGEGGKDGEAGGDSSSSAGGEDGVGGQGSTSSGTTASGQCQPSVTCASVGAECGTISDDGCGNSIECPDNCAAPNTCGGSGDQFRCGCTPLTENNFPEGTCGSVSDGCGGTIEFSTDCGDDPYVSCGGLQVNDDGTVSPGNPNTCNGECRYGDDQLKDVSCQGNMQALYNRPDLNRFWRCPTVDLQNPPREDCIHLPDGTGTGSWCCDTQE